jgi:hypothetical protein
MRNNSTNNCCTLYGKLDFTVWQTFNRTVQYDLLYNLQHSTLPLMVNYLLKTLSKQSDKYPDFLIKIYFMYFQTNGLCDCNYHFALVLIPIEFHFILLIYLAFVIRLLEDGHMIDRNIQECIVCETLTLEYLCLLFPLLFYTFD